MELEELDRKFKEITDKFPEARRGLVEKSGVKMCQKVINNINSTVGEKTGNLKKGVTSAIGSGGGYAAIRPNNKIAPHTHLIENGHKVIRGGKIVGWVPGKHMYRNALNQLSGELLQDAEKMINELAGDVFD